MFVNREILVTRGPQGPEAQAEGFRYDVSVPGNGNAGHEGEAYGTTLSAEQKRALVEYLKTL